MATVLLVADAPWVRNQVAAALTDPGTTIESVSDPRHVLDAYRELSPDAVVIDLQVGSMGGMAIARTLRDAAFTEDLSLVPLILLLDRSADAFLAKRAGADAWLTKPFNAQQLREALGAVLARPADRT